ncbi:family 16 glycoside hydrolase [Bradyrhizobium erythrophlei]|uniref:family 16 glycoside hydrolase n=1 Tax=Bradyrhizobium erythrophlei TaxID=1437360 RepID=UPI0035E6CEB0
MATSKTAQLTDFTMDILGRYMCNGFDEAMHSTDKNAQRLDGSPQSDARPFNAIIIGGGSFGGVLAQHLLYADETNSYRILVLEAGRNSLPEHFQNLPLQSQPMEMWGLPWDSDPKDKFPGLAYAVGGRSLFFGGWSPRLLDEEMDGKWPPNVVAQLKAQYFDEAARQIGTDVTNDFMHGELHAALRATLAAGIMNGKVRHAIPLNQLPLHLSGVGPNPPDELKLEAPLAVQGSAPRPGFFPMNKFSSAPLLMEASRVAQTRSGGDDVKKRLMIVPDVHVTRLVTTQRNGTTAVTAVLLMQFGMEQAVPVPDDGVVVIALGTIESTRLALTSFPNLPNTNLMGQNLIAHLRSNLTIRIPRSALPAGLPQALASSALFVKGRFQHAPNDFSYFHLQITASGLDKPTTDSEAELFKKVPEVDQLDALRQTNDDNVVITIRGIGEMSTLNPASNITLSQHLDEFGLRASVQINRTQRDEDLWNAMDEAADDVAKVFANGVPYEVFDPPQGTPKQIFTLPPTDAASTKLPFGSRRDAMGTTHHEAGPLWMGTLSGNSVTNEDCRFHHVSNAFVAGPATFPALGSPNPMLTGTALARRLGDFLKRPLPQPDPGFQLLFDGRSTAKWKMSTIANQPGRDDPGRFHLIDAGLESAPGTDLGLLYTRIDFVNYVLRLEWLASRDDDNSGVFLRFPDPASPDIHYDNRAFIGVDFGFEVQIDALGRGSPPPGQNVDKKFRTTGAIYNIANQTLDETVVANGAGRWNSFEILVRDNRFTVFLNGKQKTDFVNPDPTRGKADAGSRFIGLQTHTGRVLFRKIEIQGLP